MIFRRTDWDFLISEAAHLSCGGTQKGERHDEEEVLGSGDDRGARRTPFNGSANWRRSK